MPSDALLKALRHVWLTLHRLNVPAAVMGGIALAAWKYVRATRDIDLLVSIAGRDTEDLIRELRAAGIHSKGSAPVTSLGQLTAVQLAYEPPETFMELQVDLLLAKSDYHEQALRRQVSTRLPDLDVEIGVLACEDLILHKLLAGRIIDRADVASLLRANRETLDLDYLRPWVKDLEVTDGLNEAWDEAFPGEPLPGG
ncbi:MAG: hypothetical protein HQ567_07550 [Candidatus Nealsonbacteria bacterium]|nr:hypothetical protein [Candidatus Nealsonbacteria bacterium]